MIVPWLHDRGITIEYNQLLQRPSMALPQRELAIKVMKV